MNNQAFYEDLVDQRTISDSMKLAEAFMIRYRTAMDFVMDKLNFLNREFKLKNDYDLVDSMQHRIKRQIVFWKKWTGNTFQNARYHL
ncbi:hypothetical protein [Secundilactobacillus similis]|uniref:hypothetical protein n=1 Tax=Secundilactobacillus similis TaxID=414682 RepID=UPI0006D04910|nr:hypothetical protein [Secundilactobacillus similis]